MLNIHHRAEAAACSSFLVAVQTKNLWEKTLFFRNLELRGSRFSRSEGTDFYFSCLNRGQNDLHSIIATDSTTW